MRRLAASGTILTVALLAGGSGMMRTMAQTIVNPSGQRIVVAGQPTLAVPVADTRKLNEKQKALADETDRLLSMATELKEQVGMTSKNIDEHMTTTNPEERRFLGLEGDLGKAMGLDNKWAYNAIKQVGNAAEIWDRNMTPLGVPRGINALWNKGGLMYAPPMR